MLVSYWKITWSIIHKIPLSNSLLWREDYQHAINYAWHRLNAGTRGGAFGWGPALQTGRSRIRFAMVSLEFFIDIILPVALWPWNQLSLQQKWVPGLFPGRPVRRLTSLPPYCADFLEIWEPQPPGALTACPCLWRDCYTLFKLKYGLICGC